MKISCFNLEKESIIDVTNSTTEANKQVELESKVSKGVKGSTHIEPVHDAQGSTSVDTPPGNNITLPLGE